jgi:hypothetical protein
MSAPSTSVITQDPKTSTFHFSSSHKLATNTIGIAIGPFYKLQLLPHVDGGAQKNGEGLNRQIPLAIYAPSWEVLVEAVVEFGPFEIQHESNVSSISFLFLLLILIQLLIISLIILKFEKILCATTSILGPFPDLVEVIAVVFLPKNFSCLGLACPNLLFLSHSILRYIHKETQGMYIFCNQIFIYLYIFSELCFNSQSKEDPAINQTICDMARIVKIKRSQGIPQ